MTKKKVYWLWALASFLWTIFVVNMSGKDLLYAKDHYLHRDQIEAAYRAEIAAYAKKKSEEEGQIHLLLEAATRYQELQFFSLTAKRGLNRPYASPGVVAAGEARQNPSADREEFEGEMEALEKTYGKATLRKYRPQETGVRQNLYEDLYKRLPEPQKRESRLGAIVFQIMSLPFAVLLMMWIAELVYRQLPNLSQQFRIAERLSALLPLSMPQRVIAACAGMLMLSIQIYEFANKGIQGIGWVFSLTCAACLLLVAAHGIERASKADEPLALDTEMPDTTL